MRDHFCTSCRARSPETTSAHSLISSRHGWRIARRRRHDGSYVLDWYCPTCWRERRERSAGADSAVTESVGRTFKSVADALARVSPRRAR